MQEKRTVPSLWDAEALGRGTQWRFLREAIESVRDLGQAVWFRGEPGIGKTVLLEQAGAFAVHHGLRPLRVMGAEGEKDIPFAALHQLLWTLMDESRDLRPAARAALERALGTEPGGTAVPYSVSAASLDLLAIAARRRPLILLIDDLHWIDASSAEVLRFLQRRLGAVPIVMLATIRKDVSEAPDATGVHVLDLGPLTPEGAEGLLRDRHPDLSQSTRRRILHEAAGNPLALVELPGQLDEGQRTGRLPLPEHLPLGERLRTLFAQRVALLSPPAQFTLLLCALEGRDGPSLHLVAAAARAAGTDGVEEHLAAAERCGLIRLDQRSGRLRFRHPLVKSALVAAAAGAGRRRAHAAWAGILPTGELRQVTHRAAASAVPDESVAEALDHAAHLTQARGGDADAAYLFARAAALSGDTEGRGRRLAAAALAAVKGGRVDLAAEFLEQATAHGLPAETSATLDFTRALVRLHADGDTAPAIALLPGVLDRVSGRPAHREMRLASLFLLTLAAGYTTDAGAWESVAAHLDGESDLIHLGRDAWQAPAYRAQEAGLRFGTATRGISANSAVEDVWQFLWSGVALGTLGQRTRLLEELAHRHSYVTQAFIDAVRGYHDYLGGHWDRCVATAQAGAAASRARGFLMYERVFHYTEGYVIAARGQRHALDALAASLRPWAVARGLTFIVHRVQAMEAMCALAHGEYETAYRHASALTPPGTLPADVTQFHLVFLDLVEAAAYSGRGPEARKHAALGRALRMERISPHHAFLLLAAEAVVSEDVNGACAAVYASAGASHWPFELARVRLHHGVWLRRQGRRADAREKLGAAVEGFTALGADPWADRARQELRVCDDPRPVGRAFGGTANLTAQERRIADLVAQGLTNREIGTRLHLSPKTVAGHLYKIYPKLGITGRAGVARAIGTTVMARNGGAFPAKPLPGSVT
ncbi:AAA family ATPase [Streptomyces sp. NPDC057798]|uniref:helix-turn-helix transcriptional regulator n=1 Tax=Streptomyces sp. NPDC057798 TaxID=3346252 RepID=UPI003688751D